MTVNCHYNSSKFDSLKKVAALLPVCAFDRVASRTKDTVKSRGLLVPSLKKGTIKRFSFSLFKYFTMVEVDISKDTPQTTG